MEYSIKLYKEYFNFAASHFMIFGDGTREPLHGHNYRIKVHGKSLQLDDDMVFDFVKIKPIIREVCDSLDHKLILPAKNEKIKFSYDEKNILLSLSSGDFFSIPKQDTLLLPILNTSAERLAYYLCHEIVNLTQKRYAFTFSCMDVEVEESSGQSATYSWQPHKSESV